MSFDPQVKHIEMMKHMQPAYRYNPNEDFESWQKKARGRLETLLGLPFETCPDNFHIEWKHESETHTELRFIFTSETQVDVSCHMLIPDINAGEKRPMIICLQGHSTGMHISLGHPKYPDDEITIAGGDRDFARQIIQRGQIALAIEQRGFGERGGTPKGPACYQPAVQAMLLGRTLIGERCWDISRAIDVVLKNFPMVDADKIAIMGNSGGGTATIYAAALDTRLAAAMPSCAFCGYTASIGTQYHCLCNYVPGIMKDFDMGDLAALIAPRPMVVVNGLEDKIFPLESAKQQAAVARIAYKAANADANFMHVIGGEGHRFYAAQAWPVFDRVTGWRS